MSALRVTSLGSTAHPSQHEPRRSRSRRPRLRNAV